MQRKLEQKKRQMHCTFFNKIVELLFIVNFLFLIINAIHIHLKSCSYIVYQPTLLQLQVECRMSQYPCLISAMTKMQLSMRSILSRFETESGGLPWSWTSHQTISLMPQLLMKNTPIHAVAMLSVTEVSAIARRIPTVMIDRIRYFIKDMRQAWQAEEHGGAAACPKK